jgi:2-dehydro-3-deoxyphosphogluconate aldolase/(4S)-4-hydroxy-2-oxoglutarate aldolase
MMDVMQRIREAGLVPVIRASSPDEALKAVEAISAGGIAIFEITLTVPGAIQVIAALSSRLGDSALIGAGTVLDAETAQACIDAGAAFIVSPALDLETIAVCRRLAIPVFPGALTPTEIVAAWKAGASAVKVFPANSVGGPAYLKSLKAPLPQIEMMPTGGVSLQNAGEFIAAGALALGVGADLVKGDAATITAKAKQYVAAVRSARASLTTAP